LAPLVTPPSDRAEMHSTSHKKGISFCNLIRENSTSVPNEKTNLTCNPTLHRKASFVYGIICPAKRATEKKKEMGSRTRTDKRNNPMSTGMLWH